MNGMEIMQVFTRTNAHMQQNELDINEQDTSFKTFLLANEKEDVKALSTNEKEPMVENDEEETTDHSIGKHGETDELNSLVQDDVHENIDNSMIQPTIHMFLTNSDTTIDFNVQPNMYASKNTFEDVVQTYSKMTKEEVMQLSNEIIRYIHTETVHEPSSLQQLLDVLKKVNQLSTKDKEALFNQLEELEEEKISETFKLLVKTFEKRTEMTTQNMYQNDAIITKSTIANWLEQAFQRYDTVQSSQQIYDTVMSTQMSNPTNLPIDEVQQYDIHIRQTGKVEEISEQLVSKLTTVIQKSSIFKQDGIMLLQLQINPTQLGHITVRMAEVNGEMRVELFVTTNATKKILESNIHQLKHLFSPHQVIIEKDPTISDEEFFSNNEEELNEEERKQDKDERKDKKTPSIDFEQLLQQLGEEEENDKN